MKQKTKYALISIIVVLIPTLGIIIFVPCELNDILDLLVVSAFIAFVGYKALCFHDKVAKKKVLTVQKVIPYWLLLIMLQGLLKYHAPNLMFLAIINTILFDIACLYAIFKLYRRHKVPEIWQYVFLIIISIALIVLDLSYIQRHLN